MKTVIVIACTSLLIGCVEAPGDTDLELDETEQPSICGATDESQFVNDYDGTLGPSVSFVQAYKGSKAALASSATSTSSGKYCSGSLIATNLFLTAGHCVGSTTIGDYVSFNYERAAGSTTLLTQSHYLVEAIVEDKLGGLDYAILRLAGTPGNWWGFATAAAGDPTTGAAITIIGHPATAPKKIEAGTVASFSTNYMYYGNVDTLGGSSGSGVLDNLARIVGVHTNGGCTSTGGTNSGVRISRIHSVSRESQPYLTNGVPFTNLTGASGSNAYWRINVPAGKTLSVSISGGTGDVDLYTRFGAPPTTSIYACRPYLNGNTETCTQTTSSTAGNWYIMLRGYTAYSGVQLIGSY